MFIIKYGHGVEASHSPSQLNSLCSEVVYRLLVLSIIRATVLHLPNIGKCLLYVFPLLKYFVTD